MLLGTNGLSEAVIGLFAEDEPEQYEPYASGVSDSNVLTNLGNPEGFVHFPNFTFIIHGLGANESGWSNDFVIDTSNPAALNSYYVGGQGYFSYDDDSVVSKIENKKRDNSLIYAVVCEDEDGSKYSLFNIEHKQDSSGNDYYESSYKKIRNIPTFDPYGKHAVVLYRSNDSFQSFAKEYSNFEKIVNRLCLDFKTKHNYSPKINLIGHSRGGLIAQEYAINHPSRVYAVNTVAAPFFGSVTGKFVQDIAGYPGLGLLISALARDSFLYAPGFLDLQNKQASEDRRNRWNSISQGKNIKATAYGSCLTLPYICQMLALSAVSAEQAWMKAALTAALTPLVTAFDTINATHKLIPGEPNFTQLIDYNTFLSNCVPASVSSVAILKTALRALKDAIFGLGAAILPLLDLIPFGSLILWIQSECAIDNLAKKLAQNIVCYRGQVCVLKDDFLVSLDSQMCTGYMKYDRLVKVIDHKYLASGHVNATEKNFLVGHNLETMNRQITSSIVNRGSFASKADVDEDISSGVVYPSATRKGSVTYNLSYEDYQAHNGHGTYWGEFHASVPMTDLPANANCDSFVVTGFDNNSNATIRYGNEGLIASAYNGFVDIGFYTDYFDEFTYDLEGEIIVYYEYECDLHLDGIGIQEPSKKVFYQGETFSYEGLIVYALYSSGETEILDSNRYGVSYEPGALNTLGTHTVTITFTDNCVVSGYSLTITKTATYEITVREPQLTEIKVDPSNSQTGFYCGGSFSSDNLIVCAIYENGECSYPTDYIVDSASVNMSCPGIYPVYISYTDRGITKTTSYDVTVDNPTLESITLSGDYRTVFDYQGVFNYTGLCVTANYQEGFSREVEDFYVDSDSVDMDLPGFYPVTVTYTENGITKTASYMVEVEYRGPVLVSISLSGDYRTEFYVGEEFDADGLVVTAHYTSGAARVVEDYDLLCSGVDMTTPGTYRVYVMYEDFTGFKYANYEVTVIELQPELPHLESITLSGNYITEFLVGSVFTTYGLVVTAHYSDGRSFVVTNYDVVPEKELAKKSLVAGLYRVTVIYNDGISSASATYAVRVTKPAVSATGLIGITLSGDYQTYFDVGEKFNYDGLIVSAITGGKRPKTTPVKDYIVDDSEVDTSKPGVYIVTVLYAQGSVVVTANYTVIVGGLMIENPFNPKEPIGKF